jgi:hypothetical protein
LSFAQPRNKPYQDHSTLDSNLDLSRLTKIEISLRRLLLPLAIMVNEVGNDSEYELTGERRTPWEEAGLELKDAERLELILFQKHEPVRQEYERRLEDFDARQRRERLLFKTRESAKYENMYHGFQQRVFVRASMSPVPKEPAI